MPPRPSSAPISLVLHGDVLEASCWLAEQRIAIAADELHGRFMEVEHYPLPVRWEPRAPTAAARQRHARELKRIAREPDAPPLSPELWSADAPGPICSAPAHVALAAAGLQGRAAEARLREGLREAALVRCLDVSRPDVVVEVAARAGVDLGRFVPALEAPGTERALLDDVSDAADRGIEVSPSLVIGDDWLVAGIRSLRDYRIILKRYLATRVGTPIEHTVH